MKKKSLSVVHKSFCIRLPENLHAAVKSHSYSRGLTVQKWVADALAIKLKKEQETPDWLCELCGKWSFDKTRVGMIGQCAICKGKDLLLMPVNYEKKGNK